MLPIAVDAMGGDRAPGEIVAGARQAAEAGVPLVLVGNPETMGETGDLEVLEATESISMDEDPAGAVRRKKDSSIVVSAKAVADGKASAMVSAGNTGAAMAAALLSMGRLKGVTRPAVATVIPVPGSTPTILIDSGANPECLPAWLVQFAQMGSVLATQSYGISMPRVGLLSIGEEASKGTAVVKETHALLTETPGVKFIGNVEGRDVLTDTVDVVVTDGFTGNVVLKTLEGASTVLIGAVMKAVRSGPGSEGSAMPTGVAPLLEQLDPESYGGAMLLGVKGVCIISHGAASAKAIFNALRIGKDMVEQDLVGKLQEAVTA